ncbi:MAG: VIT1/CCC1 transporter family protein [Sphaerochaetaceae bacterium]|jgi:VIT1/CCC1 family predicted Fe2+/Mn2+ transporter|nr:VIT1/CCC1 transporter family protein [Sphaerochaetaceae bacterium]MDD3163129.1 VIT1/CCC1 transporter family protein [Sphaerochaetaceae bacterium]MDD4006649.1 VIT1/CCC1 transporter family protein [Sphaerochaetaceae bacterium]MDD4396227.1 VIT1/CCC1 transporter family protein [Sphaerochaetaceae bacterium]
MAVSDKVRKLILVMQQGEITEHHIYSRIAARLKDGDNKKIIAGIADDEKRHSEIWKQYTQTEVKPRMFKVRWLSFLSRVLGFSFVLKKMEGGEELAQKNYSIIEKEVPQVRQIIDDENRHEKELLAMLDEERLQYVGSMVLGLSDALVELSGTLAGLTFALQNTRLTALSGLITGISATLSMASSEYLSAKNEGRKDAAKSCAYTGVAYVLTVVCMILPYLLLPNDKYMVALAIMLAVVILIILGFTYYISVAKDVPFGKRFGEMAGISLSVAAISFVIGILVKKFLGIDI